MVKRHIKTLTVPVSWPIKRKGQTFVIRPYPGKSFSLSIPLSLVFKDMLKYCKTSNEVKTILKDKEILVDGKRTREQKFLVGLMDVLSLPVSKETFRVLINRKRKLELVTIPEEEKTHKVCKILGKTVLKNKKVQLNLFDSRNILVKEDKYKIGDSVLIKVPSQEIIDTFKMEKGSYAFMISGTHTGEHGTIEKTSGKLVTIKTKDATFETPIESVYVIGKNKPSIKMLD